MSYEKKICFLYTTINDEEHHISMDLNVEKKKLYCYERLTSIDYELGYMDENNEYKINKKSKPILVKPRCAHFNTNHDLSMDKGTDPEKILIKLLNHLKNTNIIICNNARFTLNSILAESVRYNIQFDLNKFLIIDINENDINNIKKVKDSFFSLYEDHEQNKN